VGCSQSHSSLISKDRVEVQVRTGEVKEGEVVGVGMTLSSEVLVTNSERGEPLERMVMSFGVRRFREGVGVEFLLGPMMLREGVGVESRVEFLLGPMMLREGVRVESRAEFLLGPRMPLSVLDSGNDLLHGGS